ncbi:unnamed protein product [Protopolystoma xenopodis]|uniref:Clathrin/coatomer adaptor adaptin-like N-terminal domain-containing protein n=1 Tax=Protopolystoma xenopodis TaxID=117903 RepID=A0A3S4ZZ29_9PLAT|nr:unnamed protein product [Protopolystoma xenopodis]
MTKILRHHPRSVHAHKDLLLHCLEDRDESIRLRALGLLQGMITKKNLIEIVHQLVRHVQAATGGAHYKAELVAQVVQICAQNNYHYITSFEWYCCFLFF